MNKQHIYAPPPPPPITTAISACCANSKKHGISISGNIITPYSFYSKTAAKNADETTAINSKTDCADNVASGALKPKRAIIRELSKASRARLLRQCRGTPDSRYCRMITLTYQNDIAPELANSQRKNLFHALQRKFAGKEKAVAGLWFREYQARGVVHYHIYFSHHVPQVWLNETWARISQQDIKLPSANIIKFAGGVAGYALKAYSAKAKQKELPPNLADSGAGRWWGVFGDSSTPLNIKVETTADINASVIEVCKLNKQRQIEVSGEVPVITFVLDKDMANYFQYFLGKLALENAMKVDSS